MKIKTKIHWNAELGYAIGLIASDGCLSMDGRHIDLTSKDYEQIENFARILKLTNKIGTKYSGSNKIIKYYRIQFGNVQFYRFLLQIGLTPKKSKSLGEIIIPDRYISDLLRGLLDGDGFTYSYWDKRWKSSFCVYTGFTSASRSHLLWLQEKIHELYAAEGKIRPGKRIYQLVYSKNASVILYSKMYYKRGIPYLSRKYSKIKRDLDIISRLKAIKA